MVNHIIKICGIRDPQMAEQTAIAGADLIGIVFAPSSPRYVDLEQAVAISFAVKKAGAAPVAVFVDHTDVEMRHICEVANIEIVQLHGAIARSHHHLLPDNYQRIYVKNNLDKTDAGLRYLDSDRDFVLLDHPEPGQGKSINKVGFHYDLPFAWLLAGGLTAANVVSAINELQPHGVDVSSGVESSKAQKDISLIKAFVTSVRGHHYAA